MTEDQIKKVTDGAGAGGVLVSGRTITELLKQKWFANIVRLVCEQQMGPALKELKEAIDELFELFDSRVLIRNIEHDHDPFRFLEEGRKITHTLGKFKAFKEAAEQELANHERPHN